MKYLLFLFCIISLPVFGQNVKRYASKDSLGVNNLDSGIIVCPVYLMPKFKGDLNKYIVDNLKLPDNLDSVAGSLTVDITFIIEKDGTVTDVKIKNEKFVAPALCKEIIRVVSSMPRWTPGMRNGQPMENQHYELPLHLNLR